jgi:replicative DNA helicase
METPTVEHLPDHLESALPASVPEEALSEDELIDAAFAELPSELRDEQHVIGAVLWRPELHRRLGLTPRDFVDPLHARIYAAAFGLWRMGRHSDAIVVADMLLHVSPMLKAGDKLTTIEQLIFTTLAWSVPEYVYALARNAGDERANY